MKRPLFRGAFVAALSSILVSSPAGAAEVERPAAAVVVAPAPVSASMPVPVPVSAPAPASELAELRAQLEALQVRLAALERAQAARQTDQQTDRQDDPRALQQSARVAAGSGIAALTWKGDLRYRTEVIDQEYLAQERYRDRIRARLGLLARVNETVSAEVQLSTGEGFDPRGANQTLTNVGARKALDLDTAYAEWRPNDRWKLTAGKMRYPWARSGSFFHDADVNPEGLAVNWQRGASGPFAAAFYTLLSERGSQADSNMLGAQAGWRGTLAGRGRWTVAAAYFDHGAVEGYDPFLDGNATNAFGNTTTSSPAVCRRGVATCLLNDYDVVELFGELRIDLAGRPLLLFADVARNLAADAGIVSATSTADVPAGLDTAWSAGFTYGRAGEPRTWEIGYVFQKVEKDALFAQWIDSDFAAGATDGDGHAVKLAYVFARNWRFNLTYYTNATNLDVPALVTVPGSAPVQTRVVGSRDYDRLQLDLNVSF
ncbi:MAG: putative porin [Gammaproteobacteria bacterium]|nr:putative porin [Gammaproteobacteria bacterium]